MVGIWKFIIDSFVDFRRCAYLRDGVDNNCDIIAFSRVTSKNG